MKFPIIEKMHIHSLDAELREATILKRLGDNDYLAEYNGVKCHAIYNPFVNKFYVDDKYGIIKDKATNRNEPSR
jgi:hypothetical protein